MSNTEYRPIGEKKNRLLDALFTVGSVELTGYRKLKLHETNPDAPLSPIFMNLRTPDNPKPGPLTPEIVQTIAELFYDYILLSGIKFDYIVGIPNAADPLVDALCKLFPDGNRKRLHLTKVNTPDGKRHIGPLTEESALEMEPGGVVLLFDDLITKAGSKIEAIRQLEEAGLKVLDVVVLIDREQGGKEELKEAGYHLLSILLLSDILSYGLATKRIDIEKYQEIKEYIQNN